MVEIHHKKNSITSLKFILNFQKNWIRFIMISKIKLKSFHINLMLELFMCLMLELLKLSKFFLLSRGNLFSLKFVISIFWQLFFEFALFFHFFPTRIAKWSKFETKNICWLRRGGREGGDPTIETKKFTKLIFFTFIKEKNEKKYFYIIKVILIYCDFFSKLCI